MSSAISCQISSIGALLRSSGKLTVPPYQRNYAWEEENYSDLWSDIQETFNGKADEYFLGSVVIDNSSSPNLTLIDGQQRVTTTTILICALKWHLLSNNFTELATLVTHDFLSRPDYDHHSLTPNLELNLNDRDFFERYIITAYDPKLLTNLTDEENYSPSNLQLAACYAYMCKEIANLFKDGQSLETVAHEIISALQEKIFLIRIDVADDLQAFTLFEALNNRGVELSEADLLKNFIFSKAEENIDELKSNWEIMCQNIGHYSLMRFLRHQWNSHKGAVPSQGLFSVIKKHTKTSADARALSQQITQSSEFYGAILEPNHDLWRRVSTKETEAIKSILGHLSLMRAEQCYILLMAVLEHSPDNFLSYLVMIRNFTFRYATICGKNTAQIQRAYMKAAHQIRQNQPDSGSESTTESIQDQTHSPGHMSANECFNQFFAELYPQDNQFQSTFAKKSIRNTALARHILAQINNHLKAPEEKLYCTTSLDIDLEHILPKKYKDHWQDKKEDFPGGLHKYIHRLGNMTLISPDSNRRLGNADFEKKRDVYQTQPLEITKRIINEPIWSADAIRRRQNWLASEATKIWKFPVNTEKNK